MTVESLDRIREEMKPGESLLICCKAFQKGCKNKFTNITIKKIPQMLLHKCEFGKEDYSLKIVNMPTEEEDDMEPEDTEPEIIRNKKGSKKHKGNSDSDQPTLF